MPTPTTGYSPQQQLAGFDPQAMGLTAMMTGATTASDSSDYSAGTQSGWYKYLGNGQSQRYDMSGADQGIYQNKGFWGGLGEGLKPIAAPILAAVTGGIYAAAGGFGGAAAGLGGAAGTLGGAMTPAELAAFEATGVGSVGGTVGAATGVAGAGAAGLNPAFDTLGNVLATGTDASANLAGLAPGVGTGAGASGALAPGLVGQGGAELALGATGSGMGGAATDTAGNIIGSGTAAEGAAALGTGAAGLGSGAAGTAGNLASLGGAASTLGGTDWLKTLLGVGTGLYGLSKANDLANQAAAQKALDNPWLTNGGQANAGAKLTGVINGDLTNDPGYNLAQTAAARASAGLSGGMSTSAAANAAINYQNQRIAALSAPAGVNFNPAANTANELSGTNASNALANSSLGAIGAALTPSNAGTQMPPWLQQYMIQSGIGV